MYGEEIVEEIEQGHTIGLTRSKVLFYKICETKMTILQYLINLNRTTRHFYFL